MLLFCICRVFRCYIRTGEIVLNILIARVENNYFVKAKCDYHSLQVVAFLQRHVAKLQHKAIFLLHFRNSID